MVISLVGMRGIGLVGQQHAEETAKKPGATEDIEMTASPSTLVHEGQLGGVMESHASSTVTLTAGGHATGKAETAKAEPEAE